MESRIRLAEPADCDRLSLLRHALWPESSAAEHASELVPILTGRPGSTLPLVVIVSHEGDGELTGFIEVGLRSHADGCDTRRPVGFVEGWYVRESHRGQGLGAKLLAAAEDWSRNHECVEIASDTWIDHIESQRVHEALGFEVVDRCVHYRKAL